MYQYNNSRRGIKNFVYFPAEANEDEQYNKTKDKNPQNFSQEILEKLLQAIGREALREKTPNLQQLEQILNEVISKEPEDSKYNEEQAKTRQTMKTDLEDRQGFGMPIVTQLIQRGYLKDSQKWLSPKGFMSIGGKILNDVMKALKTGDFGLHETSSHGTGSLLIDTTRKYELGDDIRLLNVSRSLLNAVQRVAKRSSQIKIPLDIELDDLEEYE